MADDATFYISVGSLVISLGSAAAAVVSAVIAYRAKEQAKKAATLSPRGEAIDHLHQAIAALKNVSSSALTSEPAESIRRAKILADRVYGRKIQWLLSRELQTAEHIVGSTSVDARVQLMGQLRSLIDMMNREASIGA